MSNLSRKPEATPPARWQPPGRRWGFGSGSVVPYLGQAIQSRVLEMNSLLREEGPIRNPVFADMGILVPRP